MAILINASTRIVIQGITGRMAQAHTRYMLDYGAKVVAGVTPGKGGQVVHGVPVYNTVAEAMEQAGPIDASMVLAPAYGVRDSAIEAIEAGIKLVVVVTEFVPTHDTMRIREAAGRHGARLIGPNTIGLISPGQTKVGIMPGMLYKQGNVGIVSRSGTLTHETASSLTIRGIGQSSCVGIGGDMVPGSSFEDILRLFNDDPDTHVVMLIGEIGGDSEERAAAFLKENGYNKPLVAFIAGVTSPPDKQMGHAGAIISGNAGTGESKHAALRAAGVHIAKTVDEAVNHIENLLQSGCTRTG